MSGGVATSGSVRTAPPGSASDFEAIGQAGVAALRRGDLPAARAAFEQITQAGRGNAQAWWLLAHVCTLQGDGAAEEHALEGTLAADPRHLAALLRRGDRAHARGDDRGAVAFYRFALSSAAAERVDPAVERQLEHAQRVVEAAEDRFARFIDQRLAVAADRLPGRFAESLDLMAGRKTVYLQQPTSFFYPQLPHMQFYETAGLPWAAQLEAAAPAILGEFEAAMAASGNAQLRPYVEAVAGRPAGEHALLDDSSWSALHLFKDGCPVEAEARRFPQTMAALAAAPLPAIAGRSPMALFSVLEAQTHIPPHNGMLNTRLICHLPLIVPQGCRLRVGNATRAVEHGKVMLFDDSIEHEAWNDSGERRVVLLFEVWRPELDEDERTLLTRLYESIQEYERVGDAVAPA